MWFFYFQNLNVVLEENKNVAAQKIVSECEIVSEMIQANLNLV